MAYYVEVIPLGEVINGVKIIRKEPDWTVHRLNSYQGKGSVFLCECTLCGKTIYRPANVIITGAVEPCLSCRRKYGMISLTSKQEDE